jgi:hypothetical protein
MTAEQLNATKLHDEEFDTLITVAEGIMNARPLGYVSNDGTDLQPLTPSHFLCGELFTDFIFPESLNRGGTRLYGRKFRHLQSLLQSFWERFIEEVVPNMNKLNRKWTGNDAELRQGDVVVVFEDKLRGRYPLGRVIKVIRHKGDGVGRLADVLVGKKIYRRSLARLSLLLHADELPNADCREVPKIPEMPEGEQESPEGEVEEVVVEETPPKKPPRKKAAVNKEREPLRRSSRIKKKP